MLVKCKKYSVTYPGGGQKEGDIFDLVKEQAEYYASLGWVEILPDTMQPAPTKKRGRNKDMNNVKHAVDLSKSSYVGRNLQHVFK